MTLISENNAGESPSLEDLQEWANDYNITHPVLADSGYAEILKYLRADPDFTGILDCQRNNFLLQVWSWIWSMSEYREVTLKL